MGSIAAIISDLKFSRSQLLGAIEGLSERELTEIPIYDQWTIKDVLGHVLGWDERVIKSLPLILQNRAGEVLGVEVDEHNLRSIETWRDKSFAEVLAAVKSTHRQILDIISSLDHVEIDLRRERNGRIITIRGYVIDVMIEHDRQHAVEIDQWRTELEQAIDLKAIRDTLAQNRADLEAALTGLSEAALLDKTAVGVWSVKDVIGHIVDWERLMLEAAHHIYDPSLPEVPPVSTSSDDIDEWNGILAAERETCSWRETMQDLSETREVLKGFVSKLKMGDLKLRGPYPWPDDQGTLAELLSYIAEHDADHLPALEQWRARKTNA